MGWCDGWEMWIGLILLMTTGILLAGTAQAQKPPATLLEGFASPPASYRPHTRWWWMGNAITKEELSWQLRQMHERGIGGVEQISMEAVYEKGNHPYLSEGHVGLLVHAIQEAKALGMEFSLNFGGPGWVFGGEWIPPEDGSKNLVPTWLDLEGGRRFSGDLPTGIGTPPQTGQVRARDINGDDQLVAVVAARLKKGLLEEATLTDLTPLIRDCRLTWEIPEGTWRLMAFWLANVQTQGAVDHLNKGAMERYCETIGQRFREAFGEEFGHAVESVFSDSFEVPMLDNGIYWTGGLLERFHRQYGYDLTPYLPAIWWEVGEISPKIRYDVNAFLNEVGLDAFFSTFLGWCERNGLQGRIQPYGFVTDILQGAGMAHLPEMEITAGEKDAVPWFDTRIGPKKYVASGAHLYGRNIVTVEAYTYLHWEPYRATLEELKIASDIFLRSGANKFYNHGYTCSPEHDIAPTRRFFSEILISHPNVWWRHYRALSDYVARCCYLLREGHFVADIAVYSPLANQWTQDARNARKWTRGFDWGSLGELLIANGYDFDLLNDDALQYAASFENDAIRIRDLEYRILLLPNIQAMPLETLRHIEEYIQGGGTVIALERAPECATGFRDYARQDAEAHRIAEALFDTPTWRHNPTAAREVGKGKTYHIQFVLDRSNPLEQHASALDPFLNVLRSHIRPDMGIDFVKAGIRRNEGLTHIHRRSPERDIFFVTNIQDRPIEMPVDFRITGRAPFFWNPYDGTVHPAWAYEESEETTRLPLHLAPYESTFIVFEDQPAPPHLARTTFQRLLQVDEARIEALAEENGWHTVHQADGSMTRTIVEGIPAPHRLAGPWQLSMEGPGFPRFETSLDELASWTDDPRTKHFSGTATYHTTFTLPEAYLQEDIRLSLDLGEVGTIAEVELNDRAIGMRWMRGQMLDISGCTVPGPNQLAIQITNTLINRVSGLPELPPVPEALRATYGNDLRPDSPSAKALLGYEPLPVSGLVGPVLIRPAKHLVIVNPDPSS